MKEFEEARVKGITGVPHFEIMTKMNGGEGEGQMLKAEIPGAQESETFLSVFKQIGERIGGIKVGNGGTCWEGGKLNMCRGAEEVGMPKKNTFI